MYRIPDALQEALRSHVLPAMDAVIDAIARLAAEHAAAPMLSRTHGQTASPTTVGKELAVFAYRHVNSCKGVSTDKSLCAAVKAAIRRAASANHVTATAITQPDHTAHGTKTP